MRRVVLVVVSALAVVVAIPLVDRLSDVFAPRPWRVSARVSRDGTVHEVHRGQGAGATLSGRWTAVGGWSDWWGPDGLAQAPSALAGALERSGVRRPDLRTWHRRVGAGECRYVSDHVPHELWADFLIEYPEASEGEVDPAFAGDWELSDPWIFGPDEDTGLTWAPIRLRCDGTVSGRGLGGWWRVQRGVLALSVENESERWTGTLAWGPVHGEMSSARAVDVGLFKLGRSLRRAR